MILTASNPFIECTIFSFPTYSLPTTFLLASISSLLSFHSSASFSPSHLIPPSTPLLSRFLFALLFFYFRLCLWTLSVRLCPKLLYPSPFIHTNFLSLGHAHGVLHWLILFSWFLFLKFWHNFTIYVSLNFVTFQIRPAYARASTVLTSQPPRSISLCFCFDPPSSESNQLTIIPNFGRWKIWRNQKGEG